MKIIINRCGKKKTFPLPLKAVVKILLSQKGMTEEDKKQSKKLLREAVTCLKAYKAENGPFVLIDAQEGNGEGVKIIV